MCRESNFFLLVWRVWRDLCLFRFRPRHLTAIKSNEIDPRSFTSRTVKFGEAKSDFYPLDDPCLRNNRKRSCPFSQIPYYSWIRFSLLADQMGLETLTSTLKSDYFCLQFKMTRGTFKMMFFTFIIKIWKCPGTKRSLLKSAHKNSLHYVYLV